MQKPVCQLLVLQLPVLRNQWQKFYQLKNRPYGGLKIIRTFACERVQTVFLFSVGDIFGILWLM